MTDFTDAEYKRLRFSALKCNLSQFQSKYSNEELNIILTQITSNISTYKKRYNYNGNCFATLSYHYYKIWLNENDDIRTRKIQRNVKIEITKSEIVTFNKFIPDAIKTKTNTLNDNHIKLIIQNLTDNVSSMLFMQYCTQYSLSSCHFKKQINEYAITGVVVLFFYRCWYLNISSLNDLSNNLMLVTISAMLTVCFAYYRHKLIQEINKIPFTYSPESMELLEILLQGSDTPPLDKLSGYVWGR